MNQRAQELQLARPYYREGTLHDEVAKDACDETVSSAVTLALRALAGAWPDLGETTKRMLRDQLVRGI